MKITRFLVLSLVLIFFLPLKLYAYPDNVQETYSLSSEVKALSITPNGRYIFSYSETSSSIDVFDTVTFSIVSTYSAGAQVYDLIVSTDGLEAWLVTSETDIVTVLDISDPENIEESETISIGTSSITFKNIAVATVSGKIYFYLTDEANHKVHVYNATDSTSVGDIDLTAVDATFSPIDLEVSSDGATVSVLGSAGWLAVCDTGTLAILSFIDGGQYSDPDNFTKISLGSVPGLNEVAFLLNSNTTGEVYLVNMADKITGPLVFIDADPNDGEGDTDPIVLGSNPSDIFLTTVLNPDSGESSALYLYASVPNDIKIIDTAQIGSETVTVLQTLSGVGEVKRNGIMAGSSTDAYLYAGVFDSQSLKIVSENPLVTINSPTGDTEVSSDSFDVLFESDTGGTYKVVLYTGGAQDSISENSGTELASGSISADTEETVSVSVDDLTEGENKIVIFVTAGDLIGRKGFTVSYDTIPEIPGNFRLEFGTEKIFVIFSRNSESDMDHYNLYFGTASDNLTGSDGITSPVEIEHPESGATITYILEPLTNGTQYFMNLTAVDASGNESDPTETLWETPETTIGPIGISGETGGCGTVVKVEHIDFTIGLAVFVLIGGLLFIKKRKVFLAFIFLPFLFASPVRAQEINPEKDEVISKNKEPVIPINAPLTDKEEENPIIAINDDDLAVKKHMFSGAFKVSWFMPTSSVLKSFYGTKGNEMYGFKSTYFLWNFEVGLGFDLFYEKARMLGETTGRASGEKVSLFIMPITIPVYYNLRFTDTQVLVPYAKLAYSLWYYRLSEPLNKVTGWVSHMVFGTGVKFNFEGLTSHSTSNKSIGIEHMFLLFEYTYTKHFNTEGGINFSGHNWGFGVGIDY